jgi:C4-type Zn-finger protein
MKYRKEDRGNMNMKNELAIVGRKNEIITKETTCPICGSPLEFTHFIDYCEHLVKENIKCGECGVRFQPRDFALN